jgi:hypothetical protein
MYSDAHLIVSWILLQGVDLYPETILVDILLTLSIYGIDIQGIK